MRDGDFACAVVDVMAQVFEADHWEAERVEFRQAGPQTLRLHLGADAVRVDYGRALQATLTAHGAMDIAVLGPGEADLRCLMPALRMQGRAYLTDTFAAIWRADENPLLYLLDRRMRRGVVLLVTGRVPPWELGRPACPLIHAALLDSAWTTVHSAAVGRSGEFLMLAGAGNSGKSTAAIACAQAGWDYAGDDYVLVNVESGAVAPLYASARLRPAIGHAFPEWIVRGDRHASERADPRHELVLDQLLRPGQMCGGAVRALLILRRRGSDKPTFEPATRGEAFHATFLNTNQGGPMSVTARKLAALVGRMPVFHVDTGSQPHAIPEALERFMANL